MTVEVFPTEAAVAESLARRLADEIVERGTTTLGLPTGRTPLLLYEALVRISRADRVDWTRVRTFNVDEFEGLGSGDATSYRRFMDEHLFSKVSIDPANVGFLDGRAPDLGAECARYERAIADAGGLDRLVLGIGANGHIAFNEPADGLHADTHVATLELTSRAANAWWFGGELHRVPPRALTIGLATVLGARAISVIATGESKADAVRAACQRTVTTRCPASFLQLHADVTVLVDQPVADLLDGPGGVSRR
ncbi:MAG: glucosamine-6-phosphate deaminase [Acidobacteriota bacterium]